MDLKVSLCVHCHVSVTMVTEPLQPAAIPAARVPLTGPASVATCGGTSPAPCADDGQHHLGRAAQEPQGQGSAGAQSSKHQEHPQAENSDGEALCHHCCYHGDCSLIVKRCPCASHTTSIYIYSTSSIGLVLKQTFYFGW